jgi:hypothetical protein
MAWSQPWVPRMAVPRRVRVTGRGRSSGDGPPTGLLPCIGFEDEAASAVEVDEVGGGGTVEFLELYGFVDDVGVESFVGLTGVGAREAEEVAEFREEERVAGTFGGGGQLPTGDEARRRNGHIRTISQPEAKE